MDTTRILLAFVVSSFFFFYFYVVAALISTHTKCPDCGKIMHSSRFKKDALEGEYVCNFCQQHKKDVSTL
ncbi:hypothetical protein BHU72_11590 [Desulfuribacillus stibiiarsenatis]|uniref:Uncharacterized protein n=1 Tax=Desulfuribacillus stibiiarsenatis TaxID=1390249 RepID=A0A1E5L831_9FIRM|nr:hypothetical protein BHU72_11590 [Desulfuribacillus stibiiarsenatis]